MAVREVGNLRTRLSFDDKGATSSLQRFRQDLAGLRSEMRTVTAMGKGYTNSLRGLRQQQDILNRQMRTHQERVKELNRRYQEAVKAKGEDSEEARKLARQYNNAQAEMLRTEQQLKRVTAAIENQQNPWKRLGQNLEQAGEKFKTVGQRMSEFGRDYTYRVTAPIVAGGTAIFKASMDFESAFAGVAKTFSGTEEQLQELRTAIREMAKEIPASAEEIAAVAEAAGQLGIETESIEEFTRTMIDLGEATNLTSEQAATEFARFANIVGMSQEDFDRLGSSVVALGNSMATTESEISSMAMRLAAQGAQVGMTEAQIMALAATMSSLGIQAEMGGTAMTTILKKIQSAVGEGGKSLQGFAKVARVSSDEFAKVWSKDPIKALDMFIKGLAKSGEEGENLSGILADLSIKGIYETDVLMRLAGGADLLSNAVNTSTEAWKENTALTEEAEQRYKTTESRLRILWNRIKDVAIQLGDSLAPAIMDALDAAEPFIRKIEDGAKAFSEMDKEQQQSILKMIAFVAAAGPATMVLGGIARGIGSILDVGGKVFNLFGKASGGTGLLARIASLGPMGVGGLAIGGVGLLVAGFNELIKVSEKSTEEIFNELEARKEQIQETDKLIERFESLQSKNRLSNDEMLRFLDIQDKINRAGTPDELARLTDEQAKLLEKSGLTNEEMQEFIELNDKVIEQAPNTQKAISEEGNGYAQNAQALREANEEKLRGLKLDAQKAMEDVISNENELLKENRDLIAEINDLESQLQEKNSNRVQLKEEMLEKERILNELQEEKNNLNADELVHHQSKIEAAQREYEIARDAYLAEEDKYLTTLDHLEAKNKSLEKNKEELAQLEQAKWQYEQIILATVDLNAEKGKGLETIQQEIKRLQEEKGLLSELLRSGQLNTAEYQEQNKKLDEQIGRLEVAQSELETMNELAGKEIYKPIEIEEDPKIDEFNKKVSTKVRKGVEFYGINSVKSLVPDSVRVGLNFFSKISGFFAKGTDYAPGGPAIVGEEGPELIRHRNKWALADFGLIDLPRGAQVFTHDETKRILGALNRIPAYADGARPVGEANRIVNELNNQQTNTLIPNQPMIIQLVTPDRRVLAEYVVDEITELQRFKEARIRRFADQN